MPKLNKAKQKTNKLKSFICPECEGTGYDIKLEPCCLCYGSGYADDSAYEEKFWLQKDDGKFK